MIYNICMYCAWRPICAIVCYVATMLTIVAWVAFMPNSWNYWNETITDGVKWLFDGQLEAIAIAMNASLLVLIVLAASIFMLLFYWVAGWKRHGVLFFAAVVSAGFAARIGIAYFNFAAVDSWIRDTSSSLVEMMPFYSSYSTWYNLVGADEIIGNGIVTAGIMITIGIIITLGGMLRSAEG